MSRIRSIHPGLWTDEAFVVLSPMARLFFMGIWNECDDMGSFEWSPLKLKMRLLPADAVDAPALLAEIEGSKCAMRYEVAGKSYGAIRNFCQYQRPKKPNSTYPQTDEVREWVNLEARTTRDGSDVVGNQLPTGGEEARQMEDEGGDKETVLAEAKPVKARKRASAAPEQSKFELPDWVPLEPWQAFVDMRRELERGPKKIPFTLAAAKGIVDDLRKFHGMGHDIGAILMKSAVGGYRGVFEPDRLPEKPMAPSGKQWTEDEKREYLAKIEARTSSSGADPPPAANREATSFGKPIGDLVSRLGA